MGTEDWVLKGTNLVTNTQKQKFKIQSRVCNFKNTMLKKRRRKRKRKNEQQQKKQGCKNYTENIGTKLITNTKKKKLKIQSRVWNFKNTVLKKKEEKERKKNEQTKTNNVAKIIKKIQVQN